MPSAIATDCSLELVHVTKRFGRKTAVNDVSFELRPGQIIGLVGPNGAGKTTMLRMIVDILKPDEGEIHVFGGALTHEAKNRIGYLPEERGLYQRHKVAKVLKYLSMLRRHFVRFPVHPKCFLVASHPL